MKITCKLYQTASENEKWEEGCSDGQLGKPSNADFYTITDLRVAYERGYQYGRALYQLS